MTQIAVYGCGFVGLPVSACLAEAGFEVRAVESDAGRLLQMQSEHPPADSAELSRLVVSNREAGRLRFADHAREVNAGIVFVCVGTPPLDDGSSDLSAVREAVDTIALDATCDTFIFIKSTVPPGTCMAMQNRIDAASPKHRIEIVSNPEFLRESCALHDFIHPERIVVGVQSQQAEDCARSLYEKLLGNCDVLQITGFASAELAKYASNAMLAARVAMMNDIALIAENHGADIGEVQSIVGADARIGSNYLRAGCGFGGSCLGKDVQSLDFISKEYLESGLFRAILDANKQHKLHALSHLKEFFGGSLAGLKGALWGLAFKPDTDDMRDSPAKDIADALNAEGVAVRAFDPGVHARNDLKEALQAEIALGDSALDAAKDADFVIISTAWREFAEVKPAALRQVVSQPVMIDACNVLSAAEWAEAGFHYRGMGKAF